MTVVERPWLCPRDESCKSKGRAHDSVSGYRKGCRSGLARAENGRYAKQIRLLAAKPRLVPTVGAARRIRALGALGWSRLDIGEAAGLPHKSLDRILRSPTMRLPVFEAVVRAYDELSMTPGPCERARKQAAFKGWPLPLQWDDDGPNGIDEPGASAHQAGGRDLQLEADIRRLSAKGLRLVDIAARLGRHQRSVGKVARRLRREAEEAA